MCTPILALLLLAAIPLARSTEISLNGSIGRAAHACMVHAKAKWLEHLRLAFLPVKGRHENPAWEEFQSRIRHIFPTSHTALNIAQHYNLFYQTCARPDATGDEVQWMKTQMHVYECRLEHDLDTDAYSECIQHHE
jgi:hypothetical protein